MKVRTLAEAAAEVLAKTKAAAPKEPMHTMAHQVVDLGGATHQNPQGDAVGEKAAAARSVATPPGHSVSQSTGEKMKKLPPQPGQSLGSPNTSPEEENDHPSTAGHEYMHPTHEEIEASEDETIAEEEVSSEEEVASEELTEEEIAEAREAKKKWLSERMRGMSGCKEDVDAMFNGEDLSEEFKNKVTTIFEAAVIARALAVVEEMEEEILTAAEETVSEIKHELEEQVDSYLNYMVEEWVNENEVAIETGLKAEIVEDFMTGLKNLFVENYMEIPEDKVDVVEAMAEEIASLQDRLNESMNDNIKLANAITEARKEEIVSSVCEGLTATQAEKVKTLAEGVEFTTEGDYSKKIEIIRENYFVSEPKVKETKPNQIALAESAGPAQVEDVSAPMARYMSAISRTLPR